MKATLYFTLTLFIFLTLLYVPKSFAQDDSPEYVVRIFYVFPNDRQPATDIDIKIGSLIKDVQKFYADQMEHHGFGRKTFRLETDDDGNVKVHHVKGNSALLHLVDDKSTTQADIANNIIPEINKRFDRSKNIHLVLVDIGRYYGASGGGRSDNGSAFVTTEGYFHNRSKDFYEREVNDSFLYQTIAHELGHAFGLLHDFRNNSYIMSYGVQVVNVLSPCAAKWLDTHKYFNQRPMTSNDNAEIQMLPPTFATSPAGIRLRFEITDPDGLHQVQFLPNLGRHLQPYGISLSDCKSLNGTNTTIEFINSNLLSLKKSKVLLRVIDVQGNFTETEFPVDFTHLLPDFEPVSIPDANLAAVIRDTLELSPSGNITQLEMLKLGFLENSEKIGKPLDPEHQIVDLTGLEHAKHLHYLDLSNNRIRDITPIIALKELKDLFLQNNQINNIPASNGLTQLTRLVMSNNEISDIAPTIELPQLQNLVLNENNISNIRPLAKLTQLTFLSIMRNQISDISPLSELTSLNHLRLPGNTISNITALKGLINLEWLVINENHISDINPLSGLTNLRVLDLQGNQIKDVNPLSELVNLKRLYLTNNQLSDVGPLTELTNLEYLRLTNNQISDVGPLAGLTDLEYLYLHNNQINDVGPLAGLTNLKVLYLSGNPIKDRKPLLELLKKNPDVKIYLKWGVPLPVTLSHFQAEHTNAGVVLKWTTQSEVDNAGFYIYRSETKDGEFKVINPAIIQGAGTTGERNEYTWTDTTAKPNTVYYYQIEDVSHAGVREQLATVRLRGLISAKGKLTTRWADLKAER